MNRMWLLCLVTCCLATVTWAGGAGRAFPVESENFAIMTFRKINPSLEWDHTNFLIDLSGQYANCKAHKGDLKAARKTPEGAEIWIFIDIIQGNASDVNSVDAYIRQVLNGWMDSGQYNYQMKNARRFGCSVRPKCRGTAVIACVTTDDNGGTPAEIKRTVPPRPIPSTTPYRWDDNGWDDSVEEQDVVKDNPLHGYQQKGLAFTPEQYKVGESILGNTWDRSHFLEDLSGYETDCAMIGRNDWPFELMKKPARDHDMKLTGQYGNAPNEGSTEDGLKAILKNFKPVNANQIGCSIIPDCQGPNGMEVVISCLYEEA